MICRKLSVLLLLAAWGLACGESKPPAHLLGSDEDWSRGPRNARLVIVEYGDYQCPPCVTLNRGIDAALVQHPNQVRFIFRHFPTKRHRNAERAAQAAEAAGAQGKFWEMHARLFETQREWYGVRDPLPLFTRYAAEERLDTARFVSDVQSNRFASKIRASKEQAQLLGVRGAPALFVDGRRVRKLPLRQEEAEALVLAALRDSR